MPVFRVQVHYRLGLSGKWSNVWHCSADAVDEASSVFHSECVDHLKSLLHPGATLVSTLTSDLVGDTFITDVIEEVGTSGDAGDLLPLFNSVKVILPTAGFGRPDLKYFKGYLTELGQTASFLTSGAITGFTTTLNDMIADMVTAGVPLCSHEGDNYTTVTVQSAVQMRQMHRKRRKTVTP